jgi:hypothetical protein
MNLKLKNRVVHENSWMPHLSTCSRGKYEFEKQDILTWIP